MNWFGQTFRKVHILYVSPPWARNRGQSFDAEDYASRLADAGVEAVELYCKDHHGVCYYPCSQGLAYGRNVVGEMCEAVHARGMRFIAYFSLGLDAYATGVHPEWRRTDARGQAVRWAPFDVVCLASPYRDYALSQLRELVEGYPIDGLWFDLLIHTLSSEPCYCMSCRAGFEAATGRPLPGPTPTSEERRATYAFQLTKVAALLQDARVILSKYRPDALLTYNNANAPWDPLGQTDLVSIEGHAPNHEWQSFICRWARALGKPFEVLTPGCLPSGPGSWDGFDQKPRDLLRLEAGLAAAHGGSAVFGQTPYPNGTTEAGQYEGFAYAFRPLVRLERAGLVAPESVAEVGVVLSSRPATVPDACGAQLEGARAVHRVLLDSHIQYDFLPRVRDLARYRLVVLADQVVLDDDELDCLREYVVHGGRILVIGRIGLIDGQGKPRTEQPLADLLGIADDGEAAWPFTYLFVHDERLRRGAASTPILVNNSPRRIRALDAEVLAELVRPETARTDSTTVLWGNPPPDDSVRQPGATLRQAGAGRVCYIPISLATNSKADVTAPQSRGLEDAWLRALIRNAVDLLMPERILTTDAPPGVEIVLNRHGRRLALQVVDTVRVQPEHLNIGPGAALPPGWTVWLDRQRVGSLASVSAIDGSPVTLGVDGDRYVLRLPSVDLHATFVLEPA